jgi:hypothetical protein
LGGFNVVRSLPHSQHWSFGGSSGSEPVWALPMGSSSKFYSLTLLTLHVETNYAMAWPCRAVAPEFNYYRKQAPRAVGTNCWSQSHRLTSVEFVHKDRSAGSGHLSLHPVGI